MNSTEALLQDATLFIIKQYTAIN